MVQDTVSVQPLGRAGNLPSLHQNIVAAGGLRLQSQALQRLYHRAREAVHADAGLVSGVGDKGIVQIPQVVIDCAAAGAAAHHIDVMRLHKGAVDLGLGILILPHHDGVFILPQQKIVALSAVGQHILLKGKIVIWTLGARF